MKLTTNNQIAIDQVRKLAEKAPEILKKINQKVMEECVVVAKFNIGKTTLDEERKMAIIDNMEVDVLLVPTNQMTFDDNHEENI